MPSTSSAGRNIFPFFLLPRELRDQVYESSLGTHNQKLKCGMLLKATNAPGLNLLLISKQFKKELEERSNKFKSLTINDHQDYLEREDEIDFGKRPAYKTAILPPPAAKMQVVTLDITVENLSKLEDVREWVPQIIAQMSQLKNLDIKLLIQMSRISEDTDKCRKQLEAQRDWWNVRQTKSLRVFNAGTARAKGIYLVLTGARPAQLRLVYR